MKIVLVFSTKHQSFFVAAQTEIEPTKFLKAVKYS